MLLIFPDSMFWSELSRRYQTPLHHSWLLLKIHWSTTIHQHQPLPSTQHPSEMKIQWLTNKQPSSSIWTVLQSHFSDRSNTLHYLETTTFESRWDTKSTKKRASRVKDLDIKQTWYSPQTTKISQIFFIHDISHILRRVLKYELCEQLFLLSGGMHVCLRLLLFSLLLF